MTDVGKILVLVITAFSLLFLGISTVAFSTAKNWVTATQEEKKKVDDLKTKLTDAQTGAVAAKKVLEDTKAGFAALSKGYENKISELDGKSKQYLAEITTTDSDIVAAQEKAKHLLDEIEAQRKVTLGLRQQRSAVEKRASEFKSYRTELIDRIHELERQFETATKNSSDLLTQNGRTGP
jgi:chromosome segregation ATPase